MNFHHTRIWKFIYLLFVYKKFSNFAETSPSRFIACQSQTFLRTNKETEQEPPCLVSVDIKKHFDTDKIKYSYNSAQDSHTFIPISPCLIHTVTRGTTVLWDSEHKEYGTSVFVGINDQGERIFRVYFSNHFPKPEFVTQSKKQDEDVSTEDCDEHLLVLNVKNRQTTDRIEYRFDSTTGTHTFRALEPYLFRLVVKGDQLVWKPKNTFYPNRALVFKDENDEPLIRLYFPREHEPPPLTHFRPETRVHKMGRKRLKPHTYEYIANKTPISLDVDYEWSTHQWHYAKQNDTATYTPKEGYVFGQVKEVKPLGVSNKEAVIWKARQVLEYSTKVTYDQSLSMVTVYSVNGTTRSFRKHGNQWLEESSYQYDPGLVKETCALVDLDINENGLNDFYEFSSSMKNDPLQTGKSTYKAKVGFRFDIVRRGHEVIWKASNETEFSSQVCVNRYFNVGKTNVFVYLPNGTVKQFITLGCH